MATLAQSLTGNKKGQWLVVGGGICLIWAAIAIPSLYQRNTSPGPAADNVDKTMTTPYATQAEEKESVVISLMNAGNKVVAGSALSPRAEGAMTRKVTRTSSLDLVVAHPTETVNTITALVEDLGGFVETSNSGGQDTSATLTVGVPADRFEQAKTAIRKLALSVGNERVDAQDVTRQYVDQDASLRNLRAEESQYLTILKQATTVKDMLAVSEKLSEVRGEIEQQEAEFNALSRRIETVSIGISLRTQPEAHTFGLNWRPWYQIKIALFDGLESIANYATIMVGILFYLPAAVLWMGTIAIGGVASWRIARWAGRRWFGWKSDQVAVRG